MTLVGGHPSMTPQVRHPARRRPRGEPARARSHAARTGIQPRAGQLRPRRAQRGAQARLRADPARRGDARSRRLRDRRADPGARALAPDPDHLPDRELPQRFARVPRLLGRRGRLHLQAVQPRGAPVEGRGLRRALTSSARRSSGRPQALLRAHEELEERVRARTRELATANESLRAEIEERKRIEARPADAARERAARARRRRRRSIG